jgi:hypothetical protein
MLDRNALVGCGGELEALSQRAFFLCAFGHKQLVNLASPSAQALVDRVASVNQLAHFDFRF